MLHVKERNAMQSFVSTTDSVHRRRAKFDVVGFLRETCLASMLLSVPARNR
jgi:hypothetical protein